MPLSSPTPHRLVEGAIGEVIPAEILQRTAAFGDSAVESVLRGHRADFRGLARHVGMEYASAGACIVLPPWGGAESLGLLRVRVDEMRIAWIFGDWAEEPQLVSSTSYAQSTDTTIHSYYLEWKAPRAGGQAYFTLSAEYADAGTLPGEPPIILPPDGQKFRAFIGTIVQSHADVVKVTPSSQIEWMRKIFLWGHQ